MASDADGRRFDVEMQTHSHPAIRPRLLYYWAQLYAVQLAEGQDFTELRPAYTICFLNARMFAQRQDVYHNTFGLVDGATGEEFSKHLGIHVLELPKFALGADDLRTMKEKWCYFLRHAESLDTERMPATMSDPPVMKAMEVLMKLSQSAIERGRYENRLKWERDVSVMKKDAYEKGEEKGLEKGRIAELVGKIQLCQRLLKQPPTPAEQLSQMSLDDLRRLADDLERQLLPASS
jgi:predicted transposase/invertase (TIGR01784 family)